MSFAAAPSSKRAPQRILFFVGSMNAGGAERVAATLANAWAARGDEVYLVMTHLGSQHSFYALHPQVRCVPLLHFLPRWGRWLKPWAKIRALRAVYAHIQPDVIVSFLTNVNVNVLFALGHTAVPIIVSERTHPVYSHSATFVLRLLRRWLYSRASAVVLQTEASARDFAQVYTHSRPYVVIPNPIDTELLHWQPVYERPLVAPPKLVALGRLAAVKRFELLIQAFSLLPEAYADWELHIYGEGPQRSQLTQLAQQLGVHERVFLPGRTEQPWHKLAHAQLFALCSAYEGFPNALLEAMALGLPCVAVDCPSGPAEMSQHGKVARLVPMDAGAPQLAQALAELMGDPQQRRELGRAARTSVFQHYSLEAVLCLWDNLFTTVHKEQSNSI